jgi:transcriptional regulator with XRE-family HTH domain
VARRTVVDPGFGSRMRELRDLRGLSLRALAARALSNKSQLQAFEAGNDTPSVETASRIDEALGANGVLAAMVTPAAASPRPVADFGSSVSDVVRVVTDLCADDLARRGRIRQIKFSAPAFVAPAMRWLVAPFDEQVTGGGSRSVEEPDVEMVRRATAMFRGMDNQYGCGHIREPVVRFLDCEVAPRLCDGRFDQATGASLLSAASELSQLAGWASYDSGLHGLAQRYLIVALRLAMAAADRPLGAEILAAMSHQAAYLRAPVEAVDLARAAGKVAKDAGVAAIGAEAAVLEAQGLAVQGDAAACAVALDRAERALDQADRGRDPQWIAYFDEAYLSAKFGHCFTALERGDLAERFATRSLEMDGRRYRRGRQFNLALLAHAHVQAGDVDRAAEVGVEAVTAAEGLKSVRADDYLRQIAERLYPHVGLPKVNDFMEVARPRLGAVLQPAAGLGE